MDSTSGIPSRGCSRGQPPLTDRDKSGRDLHYDRRTHFFLRGFIVSLSFGGALIALPLAAQLPPAALTMIERVVARSDPPPHQYRALRRLEAQSDKLGGSAWIEAWTAVEPATGFGYEIIGEGGSGFVRGKVLKPWLDGEKKMWTAGDPERASLTHENYSFVDRGLTPDGLAQ